MLISLNVFNSYKWCIIIRYATHMKVNDEIITKFRPRLIHCTVAVTLCDHVTMSNVKQ